MVNEKKSASQLKNLLTFIILILALMQSSVFVGKAQWWGIVAFVPYFIALAYVDYHLAFTKYEPNKVMDHIIFTTALTTITLLINPLTTLGTVAMRVVMISVARLASKRGKI